MVVAGQGNSEDGEVNGFEIGFGDRLFRAC